jgi:prephenate dehydrogenase
MGIGLINGSLAKVMRRQNLVGEIVASARRRETLERALELGLCDRITTDPAEAADGADLIVLGTPPGAMGEVAAAMAPGVGADAIVTDVGSIKAQIVRDVSPACPTQGTSCPATRSPAPSIPGPTPPRSRPSSSTAAAS